jgi:DNA-binding transcriptional MerR regulator
VELTQEEFLQRLRITPRELEEWREHNLIAPLPGAVDVFPESAIEEGELIRKFSSLGYSLPEILKIKRSVGLPVKDAKGRYVSRSDFLTIGELADRSGINVRTIKFWEEKGLIAPHRRTDGGFRLYRPGDVVLLSFIKDLQAFNYTLSEIGTILGVAGPDLGMTPALPGCPSRSWKRRVQPWNTWLKGCGRCGMPRHGSRPFLPAGCGRFRGRSKPEKGNRTPGLTFLSASWYVGAVIHPQSKDTI